MRYWKKFKTDFLHTKKQFNHFFFLFACKVFWSSNLQIEFSCVEHCMPIAFSRANSTEGMCCIISRQCWPSSVKYRRLPVVHTRFHTSGICAMCASPHWFDLIFFSFIINSPNESRALIRVDFVLTYLSTIDNKKNPLEIIAQSIGHWYEEEYHSWLLRVSTETEKKVTHAYRIGAVYYVYTYNLIYRGCGQISCCLVQGCLLLDIVCQKTKTIRHQYILNHDIWPWVEVKIVLYSVYRKVTYGVRQRHSSRGVISHENILIRVYTIVRMYECTNVRGHGHARRARRHDFANITALTSHSSTCAMHESSHRIGASCDKQLSRAGWMCMATTFALIVTMNDAFIVCAFQFPFHMICVVWWRWWLLILISVYSMVAGIVCDRWLQWLF